MTNTLALACQIQTASQNAASGLGTLGLSPAARMDISQSAAIVGPLALLSSGLLTADLIVSGTLGLLASAGFDIGQSLTAIATLPAVSASAIVGTQMDVRGTLTLSSGTITTTQITPLNAFAPLALSLASTISLSGMFLVGQGGLTLATAATIIPTQFIANPTINLGSTASATSTQTASATGPLTLNTRAITLPANTLLGGSPSILNLITRPSTATYFDNTGTLIIAPVNGPRYDYGSSGTGNGQLLLEVAGTNGLRNPRGDGAVASPLTNLATNGTFALNPLSGSANTALNGWSWFLTGTASIAWTGSNAVTLTGDGTNRAEIDTNAPITTVVGATYNVAVDVTGAAVNYRAGTVLTGATLAAGTIPVGTQGVFSFVATTTTSYVGFTNISVSPATIDNVSVVAAGTLPTNWLTLPSAGTVITVGGRGTENGIPYTDLSINGTPTGGSMYIQLETTTGIPASAGQIWTSSIYARVAAGSLPSVITVQFQTGGSAQNIFSASYTPTSAALATQRWTNTNTVTAGGTFIYTSIRLALVAGTPMSVTIRIGGVQLENNNAPTSLILPPSGTPGASSRAADVLNFAPANALAMTVAPVTATQTSTASGTGLLTLNIAPVTTVAGILLTGAGLLTLSGQGAILIPFDPVTATGSLTLGATGLATIVPVITGYADGHSDATAEGACLIATTGSADGTSDATAEGVSVDRSTSQGPPRPTWI